MDLYLTKGRIPQWRVTFAWLPLKRGIDSTLKGKPFGILSASKTLKEGISRYLRDILIFGILGILSAGKKFEGEDISISTRYPNIHPDLGYLDIHEISKYPDLGPGVVGRYASEERTAVTLTFTIANHTSFLSLPSIAI